MADKLVILANNNNNFSNISNKQKIFDSPAPIMKDLMVDEL